MSLGIYRETGSCDIWDVNMENTLYFGYANYLCDGFFCPFSETMCDGISQINLSGHHLLIRFGIYY